jgi:hypothetical protein
MERFDKFFAVSEITMAIHTEKNNCTLQGYRPPKFPRPRGMLDDEPSQGRSDEYTSCRPYEEDIEHDPSLMEEENLDQHLRTQNSWGCAK